MGTGQMMMIMGAMALLATLSLSINSTILGKYELIYEAEATIDAISVGQALLDEALTMSFDQNTLPGLPKLYSATGLTNYPLGPGGGEAISGSDSVNIPGTTGYNASQATKLQFSSVTKFNDFDDYCSYQRVVYTQRMGRFYLRDTVFYVQDDYPDNSSSVRTFQKSFLMLRYMRAGTVFYSREVFCCTTQCYTALLI